MVTKRSSAHPSRGLRSDDTPSRRAFLERVVQAAFGVTTFSLAGAPAASAEPTKTGAKRVISLFLHGAMSHVDTLDPKSSRDVMGETGSIPTKLPGVRFGEYLPELAARANEFAVVRSLSTTTGSHDPGCYLMRTGYERLGTIRHPGLGSWLHHFRGRPHRDLPATVNIGGGEGAGFLGSTYAPVPIGDPAEGLQNARGPGYVTEAKFDRRMSLADAFDEGFRRRATDPEVASYDALYADAIRLLKSSDLEAFDVAKEPEERQRAYGDTRFGKGCLLARRLVNSGVQFVEVEFKGWDQHNDLWKRLPDMAREMDAVVATLLDDLAASGLLDDTLVVVATEFGRKPRVNVNAGRDHHPAAFSGLLAGGGIRGGVVHGATDDEGFRVTEGHASVQEFNATIAKALGMPLEEEFVSPDGRPFTVSNGGEPIDALF